MSEQLSAKQKYLDLFLVSIVSLFLELLIIRWLGSEIRAFSIFKNFPLIAAYIGLGYGLMTSGGNQRLFKWFPALFLVLVVMVTTSQWTGATDMLMPGLRVASITTGWWDQTHPPAAAAANPTLYMATSFAFFFALIALTSVTMAGIGQRLGSLFSGDKPLKSYLVNLLGAAVGIAAFSLLSFLCTGPTIWLAFGCAACMWIYRSDKLALVLLAATVAINALIPVKSVFQTEPGTTATVLWSPYHRVELVPLPFNNKAGYEISVNKAFFQQPLNLSDSFINTLPEEQQKKVREFRLDQYELPYFFFKPKRVLIMGSGTGNDIACALRNGVEHVDAVEIDPMMVKLGRQLHPEHPYDSPKVNVVVNDARAFLRQNKEKYDLVMTGFLDSHTVAGNSLSVRLDDYVYTMEGMRDAMSHLNPDGMYCITYCSVASFVPKRLCENLRLAMGGKDDMVVLQKTNGAIYHLLAHPTAAVRAKVPELQSLGFRDASNVDKEEYVRPSTDDWPFLYLSPISFDPLYFVINACILIFAGIVCGRDVARYSAPRRWHFFCLGAGFLLLELAIIDRLSLIFGTTWLVNSVCIFAVLAAIIGANILIINRPKLMPVPVMYLCLIGSLFTIYAVPIQTFNSLGVWQGGSIAAVLSAVPIFFAGLIFSTSFAEETNPSAGLAFNMLGSVIGGLLEYMGTYTGIRSLLLLAACFYVASLLIWLKARDVKSVQAAGESCSSA